MTTDPHDIRQALLKASDALARRPSAGLHADAPAIAVWDGGLRTRVQHAALPPIASDMPQALGGGGILPSPGWYFRAGVAACMTTSIAMQAALRGVRLTQLEVEAHSESDARGLLGTDPDVPSGPLRFVLTVRLRADGTDAAGLRDLVAAANERSAMSDGLRRALVVDVDLRLEE